MKKHLHAVRDFYSQKTAQAGVATTLLVMSLPSFAVSNVDYVAVVAAITVEVMAAIGAGIALAGLITGGRVGMRFLKSVFAK